MPSLCAISSKKPAHLKDAILRMVRSLSSGEDKQVRGFIGDAVFNGSSTSLMIPDRPARVASAMVGAGGHGNKTLIDSPNLRAEADSTARSFLLNIPEEGTVSPLFGSAIIHENDDVIVARDPLGTRPMSIGGGKFTGAASDRRALGAAGLESITPMPPSRFHRLAQNTATSTSIKFASERASSEIGVQAEKFIKNLSAFIEALPEPRGLFFSGGIDSLILSKVCEELGETILITTGIKGCKDISRARSASKYLPFERELVEIPIKSIQTDIEFLREISGESKPMQIAIALPILHAARAARAMGLKTAVAGHGADELFGGYHRYISDPDPRKSMHSDLLNLHSRGMEISDLASRANNVEFFLPYLDQSVIDIAYSLPTKNLIDCSGRKKILRKVGLELGLPEDVVMAKKCAIQYGSGVNKHVFKIIGRK